MLNKQKSIKYLLYSILLFNISLIIYYIFFEYQNLFHSDSAVKNQLAQEIFETGDYFPKDWNYVNGDLWVFFGHTFIFPFLLFFKNSFTLHAISDVIATFLIILTTYMVASVLTKNQTLKILSMALITSGISPYVVESLYGQASYGILYCMAGFMLFFSVKYLFEDDNKKWLWLLFFFFTVVVIFWSNPGRALLMFGLPLFFAIFTLVLQELKLSSYSFSIEIKKQLIFLLFTIFAILIGTILHIWIMSLTNNINGASNALWLPFELMIKNIGLTLEGIIYIFGGIPTAMSSIKTPFALYEAIRFISGLLLIFLIIRSFKISLNSDQKSLQFASVFILTSLLFILFIYITTTVPDMNFPLESSRYLIPFFLLAFLLFVATAFNNGFQGHTKTISIAIMVIFIISAPYSMLSGQRQVYMQKLDTNQQKLIDFLINKKLEYGYSTFWNAGKLTVLSNDKIKIRQINIQNGLPQPMRWLSSDRWYATKAWKGKTFILLTEEESKKINLSLLYKLKINPIETLKFDRWIIYIFYDNLSNHILGWDTTYNKKTILMPSAQTPHNIGSYIQHNYKSVMHAEEKETGYLCFGPFIRIEKGQYRAMFEIESQKNGDISNDYGEVDVASHSGTVIHAKSIIHTGKQNIMLDFNISRKTDFLELRAFSNGKRPMSLYSISLVKI